MGRRIDYDDLMGRVISWARGNLPGAQAATYLKLTLADGREIALLLGGGEEPAADDGPFEASPLQARILASLEGRGMTSDTLAQACDTDRRNPFRGRSLEELKARGLVAWKRRVGLYRPDFPPEEAFAD